MVVNLNDFIDLLAEICKNKKIQCTLKSCAKGAVITGAFSCVGGLMLGPVGFAIGGALGGVVAGSTSSEFTSVSEIIINMSQKEKEQLCNKVVYAFRDIGLADIAAVAAVVMSGDAMKEIAIKEVLNYLSEEKGLQICR